MSRRWLPVLLGCLVAFGCGGAGGGASEEAGRAALELSVVWPSRSRVVPAASESIRTVVRAALDQPPIKEMTLTRPAAAGLISQIPHEILYVTSDALDASGKVLGTRTIQVDFSAGSSIGLALDLDSTITALQISPSSPSVVIGGATTLTAAATNSNGDGVLLTPSKLEWSIKSGERIASVNLKTGVVTGASPGEAVVKVLDTESGVSAEAIVTVIPAPGLHELEPGSELQTLSSRISADGSVIVGNTTSNSQAFRWTSAGGTEFLGTLGGVSSLAQDVSNDGQTVVGWAFTSSSAHRAFRWTRSGGMQNLGTLGGSASYGYATNADGSIVVGGSAGVDGVERAFVWTASGGMKQVDSALGQSAAFGISSDGSVIVGQTFVEGIQKAFKWTQSGGVQMLGSFGGWSQAGAVSDDGSVVIGTSQVSGVVRKAFLWTQAGGMQDLGTLGGAHSGAADLSGDGKVVVGTSQNADGFERGFTWTNARGMLPIGTLGGGNSTASGISNDGMRLTGSALTAANLAKAYWMQTP
jgi:probable HAF family extracellular repeat protein